MSDIDFQNGLVCGMSLKGLISSGEVYEPICYNDEGHYDYFYIDFKKPASPFSLGMLTESIVVHDSAQIPITGFSQVSSNKYKIYADISNKTHGITVINKASSYLYFVDGSKIPSFSVLFYVAGIVTYTRLKYLYDSTNYKECYSDVIETVTVDDSATSIDGGSCYDSITFTGFSPSNINEKTVSVVLT